MKIEQQQILIISVISVIGIFTISKLIYGKPKQKKQEVKKKLRPCLTFFILPNSSDNEDEGKVKGNYNNNNKNLGKIKNYIKRINKKTDKTEKLAKLQKKDQIFFYLLNNVSNLAASSSSNTIKIKK